MIQVPFDKKRAKRCVEELRLKAEKLLETSLYLPEPDSEVRFYNGREPAYVSMSSSSEIGLTMKEMLHLVENSEARLTEEIASILAAVTGCKPMITPKWLLGFNRWEHGSRKFERALLPHPVPSDSEQALSYRLWDVAQTREFLSLSVAPVVQSFLESVGFAALPVFSRHDGSVKWTLGKRSLNLSVKANLVLRTLVICDQFFVMNLDTPEDFESKKSKLEAALRNWSRGEFDGYS